MRFFLDNMLPPHLARGLDALSARDGHQVAHLRDRFGESTDDEDWLPALAADGDWVVISGDFRIYRTKHLRAIWDDAGLTTFFLLPGWSNLKYWEKCRKLVHRWPEIIQTASSFKRGSAFKLGVTSKLDPLV